MEKRESERWSAFTDDELEAISAVGYMVHSDLDGEPHETLRDEARAEIERRQKGDDGA